MVNDKNGLFHQYISWAHLCQSRYPEGGSSLLPSPFSQIANRNVVIIWGHDLHSSLNLWWSKVIRYYRFTPDTPVSHYKVLTQSNLSTSVDRFDCVKTVPIHCTGWLFKLLIRRTAIRLLELEVGFDAGTAAVSAAALVSHVMQCTKNPSSSTRTLKTISI